MRGVRRHFVAAAENDPALHTFGPSPCVLGINVALRHASAACRRCINPRVAELHFVAAASRPRGTRRLAPSWQPSASVWPSRASAGATCGSPPRLSWRTPPRCSGWPARRPLVSRLGRDSDRRPPSIAPTWGLLPLSCYLHLRLVTFIRGLLPLTFGSAKGTPLAVWDLPGPPGLSGPHIVGTGSR